MRIGSLFSGYGGLDMAVREVLGGRVAWHCEIDPPPARILAHHHPDVPNLGDITAADWAGVEPVDVLTGGFPCQDVSLAGRRAGISSGTRSGLWNHMADVIDRLRPGLVAIENVRGLLSAHADSPLEPCPWCVGGGPVSGLRALGAVLGDLADLGYDARWCGLRAADVGAPHARFRVFVVAWPAADTDGVGQVRGGSSRGWWGGPADDDLAAADTSGWELQRRGVSGVLAGEAGPGEGEGTQRERDRHPAGDGSAAAADPSGGRREEHPERHLGEETGQQAPLGGNPAGRVLDWGAYEPAIRRWEHILGRVAPAPTQTSKRGGQQLSPGFVEWMMGLPAGHVTGVPGLSRAEQLKALGNGVVPQQAAAALRAMLPAVEAVAA